jgi:hypothetical protein
MCHSFGRQAGLAEMSRGCASGNSYKQQYQASVATVSAVEKSVWTLTTYVHRPAITTVPPVARRGGVR